MRYLITLNEQTRVFYLYRVEASGEVKLIDEGESSKKLAKSAMERDAFTVSHVYDVRFEK